MLSENYKQEAFALLEKMSDTELEEVLLKIGSIRQWRSHSEDNTPKRRRMKFGDNFIPCFDEVIKRGNGKLTIIKKMDAEKSANHMRVAYHVTAKDAERYNYLDSIEYHTGGTSSDIIGMTQTYSFEEFVREIFDEDFLYNGAVLEICGGGIIYYGEKDFIQSIKELAVKAVLITGLKSEGCKIVG